MSFKIPSFLTPTNQAYVISIFGRVRFKFIVHFVRAYIAYKGARDVTDDYLWVNGEHQGEHSTDTNLRAQMNSLSATGSVG